MINLNFTEAMKKIDASDMLGFAETFGGQCRGAVKIGLESEIPAPEGVANIIVAGMGGSAVGGDLLRSYLSDTIDKPIAVCRSYKMPAYVNDNTLVIISSCSGNTEETFSAMQDAEKKGASILCVTSGGKVGERAKEKGHAMIKLPPFNSPRAALGNLYMPVLSLLSKWGWIPDQTAALEETVSLMDSLARDYNRDVPVERNEAKKLAVMIVGKFPIVYSSTDVIDTVALRWRCQFNENSKVLGINNVFPELNHNEIVGWETAEKMPGDFQVIILRDKDDYSRIAKRMDITTGIIKDCSGNVYNVCSQGESRLARLFSLIYLGDFVSIYLGIIQGIDPTPIKSIDRLKTELSKV
jgi:glucose/mannose-6-phosphate isomerase